MHDKPQDKTKTPVPVPGIHPLKGLTQAEFAALGAHQVVFEREINAERLTQLLPGAEIQSESSVFYLIVAADGSPILVTDSYDAVEDWLDDADVDLVAVH